MHIVRMQSCGRQTMSVPSQIRSIEQALADAGLSVRALCARAGVNQSTWTRWKAGSNTPNMSTWSRVQEAFESMINDRGAA